MKYKVTYTYDNPSCAGPYKGSTTSDVPYKRGDNIRAAFGAATVKSCREIKVQGTLE